MYLRPNKIILNYILEWFLLFLSKGTKELSIRFSCPKTYDKVKETALLSLKRLQSLVITKNVSKQQKHLLSLFMMSFMSKKQGA